jgi:hypothetical protein
MLTGMTERDWSIVLEVFDAAQSSRGEPGHDDRKFLESIHYFTVHSLSHPLILTPQQNLGKTPFPSTPLRISPSAA